MNIQKKKDHRAREFSVFAHCKTDAPYRDPERQSNANSVSVTLDMLVSCIKTGDELRRGLPFKNTIELIRSEPDEKKRRALKLKLPAVSLSVLCSRDSRKKDFISSPCLLQIDIDVKDNEHIFEDAHKLAALREKLASDPFIVFTCKSPSNNVKAAIHYNYDSKHSEAFDNAESYFKHEYGVNIDKSCKDLARLMMLTYDPDIHVNYNAPALQYFAPVQKESIPDAAVLPHLEQLHKYDIDYICEQIDQQKIVLINDYEKYFRIAFCLATEYGARGEDYFHILCRQHVKYDRNEAVKKYADAVKNGKNEITIGYLLELTKDAGVHWLRLKRDILQRTVIKKSTPDAAVKSPTVTGIFWDIHNGVVKFNQHDLFTWLKDTYNIKLVKLSTYDNAETPAPYMLTTCSNHILKPISISDLRNYVGQHIDRIESINERDIIKNAMLNKIGKLITDANIDMFFDIVDHQQQYDDKNTMFFPFQNGIVNVTSKGVTITPYDDATGYFWQHEVSQHAYYSKNETSVFDDFVKRISMNADLTYNEKNEHWFKWILGYLLHRRDRLEGNEKRMVILTEHNIDSDVANGGSGKNLFLRACENLRPTIVVGSGAYTSGGTFSFQNMNASTHIYGISDPKSFKLKDIYEFITGGVWVEKKNRQPYKAYPRIVGMFNNMPKGANDSDERRMFVCVFSHFFNAQNKGFEYYGQHIFDDFTNNAWNAFYSYMFECCRIYLNTPDAPPVYAPDGFEDSKLLLNTSEHFLNSMKAFLSIGMLRHEDEQPIFDSKNGQYTVSMEYLYNAYTWHFRDREKQLSKQVFSNYVVMYYRAKNYYISKLKKRYSYSPDKVVWCYVITPREDIVSDEPDEPM